ncbi:hypothetical protein ACRALDRAFT_1064057 [Sodiomyces alcalophilus JCM 7366]|uniref:uncharacterized protein n=1 Tax=Sodiomyces alcalophilus JCM 7366 TaxID=591952 RepID=UPI0039B3FCA8
MKPLTAANSTYRVSKPNAKSTGRKPSFAVANLERMDASQANILPAYDMSQTVPSQLNGGVPLGLMPTPRPSLEYNQGIPLTPNGTLHSPMAYPQYQLPMAPLASHNSQEVPAMSSVVGSGMAAASEMPTAVKPAGGRSCCSAGQKDTPPDSAESSPRIAPTPQGGGCCSSKNVPSPAEPSATPTNSIPTGNGAAAMVPFQNSMNFGQPMYPSYYPQPTLFTYPPQYGSYLAPLQPAQWRQAMQAFQLGQPVPQQTPYDMTTPLSFNTNDGLAPQHVGGTTVGVSHICTCGDGCQCVGCAAHPYNEATQNCIKSAWQTMVGEDPYFHTNGATSAKNASTMQGNMDGLANLNTDLTSDVRPAADARGGSPSAPQTPSDTASAVNEELSANDFFFVEYPFESCLGETASCPCGDDCQCIGCEIHNHPGVLC